MLRPSARHTIPISLIIHILPLLFFVGEGDGKKGNGRGSMFDGVKAGDIIPKERPTEVNIIVPEDKNPIFTKKKKAVNADKECPDAWYGGIGIQTTYNGNGDRIYIIYPGYPADLGGLQLGDVITDVDGGEITGTPGSTVKITILRGKTFIKVSIVRGKICYNR